MGPGPGVPGPGVSVCDEAEGGVGVVAAERIAPPLSKLGVLHSDEALPDSVVLVTSQIGKSDPALTGGIVQSAAICPNWTVRHRAHLVIHQVLHRGRRGAVGPSSKRSWCPDCQDYYNHLGNLLHRANHDAGRDRPAGRRCTRLSWFTL